MNSKKTNNDCFGEYRGSENQIAIVQYLIDVNHKNKAGDNVKL